MRVCMKPIGSKSISVQEQGGNNSTQDEYKHPGWRGETDYLQEKLKKMGKEV